MAKKCIICQKPITKERRKTCSKKCRYKAVSLANRKENHRKIVEIVCKYCGKFIRTRSQFKMSHQYFKKGYCTRRCQKLAERIEKTCLMCGKKFKVKKCQETAKYCSQDCYNKSKKGKIVNQMFGSDNPNWNPNKQPRTYPSPYLKEKVMERDNYKCYICGSKEDLHVHHAREFRFVRKHDYNNLLTLCSTCHWLVHRKQYQLSESGVEGRYAVWMIQ